jgi:RNA polymerase primary sigma factor
MRQLKISRSITNRDSPSVEKYLQEIGKVALIPADEEVQLSIAIRNGDHKALEKLVKGNLRFVVSVAKQYQGQGLSLPDLINEGNLGLMKAASKFDHTRGFKFISFAVWWIRQSILQAIVVHARMIRLPLNKVVLKNQIQKASATLEQSLERAPSAEELAEVLDIELSEVESGLGMNERTLSLDVPLSDDDDGTLLDTFNDPNSERTDEDLNHRESLNLEIRRSMRMLTERQQETLRCFFGIGLDRPMSLEDIGKKFDLTPERVRQIKDKAIMKLRNMGNFEILRAYL